MAVAAPPLQERQVQTRLQPIDFLRGLVMVIMALDHTRDFFHSGAMSFSPEDLTRTTPAIFFTRWITHFCAPVFMFCAGTSAFLWLDQHRNKTQLAHFLWRRGLWLILLELTVVRFGLFFNFDYSVILLSIFWALGMSMIALGGLVFLPHRALLFFSISLIALHNMFDVVKSLQFGRFAWLWQVLHEQGISLTGGPALFTAYPLVPWIGVMSAGFCFGRVYTLRPKRRQRLLIRLGLAMTAGFVVLRAMNGYGDPRPWVPQQGLIFTLISFLNCTKYPPSLDFLLMTLGPAIAFLGWFDQARLSIRNPLVVFGRVPLFYFLVHIPLIHLLSLVFAALRYGIGAFLLVPPPTLGGPRQLFPPNYGWDLWVVYAVWLLVLVLLYPVCLWFCRLKQQRKDWWLRYL
jgi:uncharacterized membrane protein